MHHVGECAIQTSAFMMIMIKGIAHNDLTGDAFWIPLILMQNVMVILRYYSATLKYRRQDYSVVGFFL